MELRIAKNGGFCYGVKRAVHLLEREIEKGTSPLYTLGELIHNQVVVAEFAEQGVRAIQSLDEAEPGATVLIRAHGTVPQVWDEAERKGIRLIDATCPDVRKVQKHAQVAADEGKTVYIAGKPEHPEVIGIAGWANGHAVVLQNEAAAERVTLSGEAVLLAQTTMAEDVFEKIDFVLQKKSGTVTKIHSICPTTSRRQEEAKLLCKGADAAIVIGSEKSSNTRELYAIACSQCRNVWIVEKVEDLPLEKLTFYGIISVIAGASTPSKTMMEVFNRMNELEKKAGQILPGQIVESYGIVDTEKPAMTAEEQDFLNALDETMTPIRNGQVMTGTVVQVTDGEVSVNIGYKSDGFIPRSEFVSDDGSQKDIKPGDEIEVEVIKVNDSEGNVLLSHKSVEARKAWDAFVDRAEEDGAILDGIGREVVKGGLIAYIDGVRTFIPASQVSNRYVENLSDYVNKPLRLKILEIDRNKRRVVASQKLVLQEEAAEKKKEVWQSLEVGQKRTGVVRRLTDFGAFVDIGGIDGLVHVTEMAWGRVKHPKDIFQEGQEIEVVIKALDEERERISLGYKELQPDPWNEASGQFAIGSIVEGKVVRIKPFGAFVSLAPRIDGLIHISQVATRRIDKVEDELKVGQTVRAKVLSVDIEAKRISLSTREVLLEEQAEAVEASEEEIAAAVENEIEHATSSLADVLGEKLELADEPGAVEEISVEITDDGDIIVEEAIAVEEVEK